MASRRKFIQTVALGTAVVNLTNCVEKNDETLGVPPGFGGIAVTTWDQDLAVNNVVWKNIQEGKSALDAVEQAAISVENTQSCCVGLGGNPDRDGRVSLDACIMDHLYNCGSVAGLTRIGNPSRLARKVMEKTPHVILVGEGAQKFAISEGMVLAPDMLSEDAKKAYEEWLVTSKYNPKINIEQNQNTKSPLKLKDGSFNHDTMGIVAIDKENNIAGVCTTSGMAFKMAGRVGDSPIIGSGLYVDNGVGGAVASGQGEEVIRVCGTFLVVEFMRQGNSPLEACKKAVDRIIQVNPEKAKNFQVGFVAINKKGEHGAYAIQPGFTYGVSKGNDRQEVIKAKSVFESTK